MARHSHGIRDTAGSFKSWLALPCLGILVCLAACGGTPQQAKPIAHGRGIPKDYTEFRDASRGYSLAVPSSWIQINVQSPTAAAAFAKLVKEKPRIAKIYGSDFLSLVKKNVSLLAIAPNRGGANMVVVSAISGTLSAAKLATLYSSQIKPAYSQIGAQIPSHQIGRLDGYPDLRVQIIVSIGSASLKETQFLWGVHGNSYILTVTETPAAMTDKIARTVRFT